MHLLQDWQLLFVISVLWISTLFILVLTEQDVDTQAALERTFEWGIIFVCE